MINDLKLVDTSQLDAGLTAIADLLREKINDDTVEFTFPNTFIEIISLIDTIPYPPTEEENEDPVSN